jgi:hypothetical protein
MWLAWLAQLGIGIIVACVSAWITVRLSLRRFRDEKWWERKAAAYAAGVEALHHLKRSLQDELSYLDTGSHPVIESRRGYLTERFDSQMEAVHEVVDTAPFLLSKKANDTLGEFMKAWAIAESSSHEEFILACSYKAQEALEATTHCLDGLINSGKEDLGVGRDGIIR